MTKVVSSCHSCRFHCEAEPESCAEKALIEAEMTSSMNEYRPSGTDVGCPLAQLVYERPLPSVHTKCISQLTSFMPIQKSALYLSICVVRKAKRKEQLFLNSTKSPKMCFIYFHYEMLPSQTTTKKNSL